MEFKRLYMAYDMGAGGIGTTEGTAVKVEGKQIDDILAIISKDIKDIMDTLNTTVQVTSYQEGAHDMVQSAVNAVIGTLKNMESDLTKAANKVNEVRTAYKESATTLEQKLAEIIAGLKDNA